MENDIFCQIEEKLKDQIIDQTKNFFLIHDGFPLLEGHLLLIPKKHFNCYLNLPKNLLPEFKRFKKRIQFFLKKNYQEPVIFEHGIAGQTVLHAHLHFLPTDNLVIDQLKNYGQVIEQRIIPYLYFEYQDKNFYFQPKKDIPPGLIHSILYPPLLNRPKIGEERKKDLSQWLLKVKKKYSLWREKK